MLLGETSLYDKRVLKRWPNLTMKERNCRCFFRFTIETACTEPVVCNEQAEDDRLSLSHRLFDFVDLLFQGFVSLHFALHDERSATAVRCDLTWPNFADELIGCPT